jgi:hypothetical protein
MGQLKMKDGRNGGYFEAYGRCFGLPRAIRKVMAFLWRMLWRVLSAKVWGVFVTTFAVAKNAAKGIKGHFVALDGSREKK